MGAAIGYAKTSATHHFDFPLALTYGVVSNLEFGIGSGGVLEEREEALERTQAVGGFADFVLHTKWNPVKQDQHGASFTLADSVKLPTADHDRDLGTGQADFDVTLIASRYWDRLGNLGTHINAGYTWIGDDVDLVHYGIAVECPLPNRLCLVSEIFADTPVNDAHVTGIAINGGLRFLWFDGLTLDAAIGTGLRGDRPDLTATAGLTWDFSVAAPNDD